MLAMALGKPFGLHQIDTQVHGRIACLLSLPRG